MCPVSSSTGSVSSGETSWEAGDPATPFTGENYYKNLISLANTAPIENVFKHYGVHFNEQHKAICPFKSHKGGRESTPSFKHYPDTNSYWCFGCHIGTRACDFVAEMDKCSRYVAATKILELFGSDVDPDYAHNTKNLPERLEIMMDFSNTVREFRQTYLDIKSQEFIEFVCRVYDQHNLKRKNLDNEALKRLVEQIKEKITLHKP
jgi:DNA primase